MITIFSGPSLWREDLSAYIGFDFRPPAICGDLLTAVEAGAQVIGLIDGRFENVRSVWHKEILIALASGVRVLGASSMGALRAAECHAFGMEGVGAIFDDYLAGKRVADADVAVTHAPSELGHRPLTLALIDAEYIIFQAYERGDISDAEHGDLMAAARMLFFKERTWSTICRNTTMPPGRIEQLRDAEGKAGRLPKTTDALALLDACQSCRNPNTPPPISRRDVVITRLLVNI